MLNKITIMGRLAKDPELHTTQNGVSVTSFRIACDRDFKTQSGEKETDWIDIVAWRNTAEFVSKFFQKGRMAIVEGRLQTREWTDKDGNKRTAVEVVAEQVYFGDSQKENNFVPQQGGKSGNGSYAPPQGGYAPMQNTNNNFVPQGGYAPKPGYGGGFDEIEQEDGDLPF